MKRPAEEDYNSNVHAKRSKDEEDGAGQSATLRFLLESKVSNCKTNIIPAAQTVTDYNHSP